MINQWAKQQKEAKKRILVVYMPLSWSHISQKVFKSFLDMISPEICDELHIKENIKVIPFIHDAFPLDFNRNDAIERCINDYCADFIMFVDGDQIVPRETLLTLVESITDEFPIVTGMYYRKLEPHLATVGKYCEMNDSLRRKFLSLREQGLITQKGEQCLYFNPFEYSGQKDLFSVDVFGMGCVLVHTDVFNKLEQPYFKYINGYSAGDHTFDRSSEDMWFCAQVKKAGIDVLCNPLIQAGHLVEKVVTFEDSKLIERPKIEIKEQIWMELQK